MVRHLISLLLLTLLTGCGTQTNRHRPELLTPETFSGDKGVVLLSAGAPRGNPITAIFLQLFTDGDTSRPLGVFGVDSAYIKSDFTTHHGFLHAVVLSPGRYHFEPFLAHPAYIPTYVPKFEFSVAAGEITYLGEYHLVSFQRSGIDEVEIGGEFSDQSARDLPLFAARNPRLDVSKAHIRLPTVAAGGKDSPR
jgi:hypothetical protein